MRGVATPGCRKQEKAAGTQTRAAATATDRAMEYTKTVTVKRTYNVEFYPGVFDCTVGEFIQRREQLGVPTQEFKTCFICGRHLAMNRIPIVISVSGKGNRFACDKCYEKSQREKEHEKTEL